MRYGTWLAGCAAVTTLCGVALLHGQQQPETTVSLVWPSDQDYLISKNTFDATITPPGSAFKRLEYFVDGKVACTVQPPRTKCEWDAGPSTAPRRVQAILTLPSGWQVRSAEVVTLGVDYEDKADVRSVLVTANVKDKNGEFRQGIPQSAFRVFEDGAPQQITYFQSQDVPLDIVVAVDVSGSMIDDMPVLKKAVKAFVTSVRPIDTVTVWAFNDHMYRLPTRYGTTSGTVNNRPLLDAVDSLKAAGGTALYDTIWKAVKTLQGQTHRARAVIAFTDGEDRNSSVGPEIVEKAIKQSDAKLFMIVQGAESATKEGRRIIKQLTESSGGRAYGTARIAELESKLLQISNDMQLLYLFAYSPTNSALDGSYRTISVKIEGMDAVVSARPGYVAAPAR